MPAGAAEAAGLYLVSDYAVPGDGQNDAAPALRILLGIVAAAGGGAIQFVSGQTYLIGSTVVVPASTNGIELSIPTGATIKARNGLNADIFQATGLAFFEISGGGVIDGNRANQTAGNAITLTSCTEPFITDVLVQNCYQDGISLSGCTRALLNCFSISNGRHGVYVAGASVFPTGMVVARDNGQRVAGSGVTFDGASTDANLQVTATDTRVGGAKTQQYGVLEVAASGCDRNVIMGALNGNATGAASLIGASSKRIETSATVGGVPVTQAFGDAAAAGASANASAADHRHGMPGNASVGTAQLAANAVTQAASVDGSTPSPTTTSTTYVDLPDIVLTLTTGGGDLLCWLNAVFAETTGGPSDVMNLGLSLDGAAEVGVVGQIGSLTNQQLVASTNTRFAAPAAGSHTVKGRWKVAAGTFTASGTQRHLMVLEVKR